MSKNRFYADGLNFECTGCGNCCKLAGGFVYVTDTEIRNLAELLSLSLSDFTDRYLETHDGRDVLRSNAEACVFLKDNACSVYGARPMQCRTFPFWAVNLKSLYRWKIIALECEGLGRGRHYIRDEIEGILKTRKPTGPGPASDDPRQNRNQRHS